MATVSLRECIGKSYKEFWNFKGRYRICKGGRASKKSVTTACWIIYNMMKYPLANTLVIRRFYNTHRDSTVAELLWAMNRLQVRHLWKVTMNPLMITYIPTGQKILFRGFDDPQSITSITVETGVLCWCWIEEAFQITDEAEFNKLDMSIRGSVPEGYFKQITMTFNPWSENIWIKKRFFDAYDKGDVGDDGYGGPNLLCMTTCYLDNEFLDPPDIAQFEYMKEHYPRRYQIEGLGHWGIAEGLVYNDFEVKYFEEDDIFREEDKYGRPLARYMYGLDFGYSNDPTAFAVMAVNEKKKTIYFIDERYMYHCTNDMIYSELKESGYDKCLVYADSAEPKSIAELQNLGMTRIRPSKKGADSIRAGIQKIQDYHIIIHPRCKNAIVEFNNYIWDKNLEGRVLNKPVDDYNHLMDAMRYGCEKLGMENFSF